MFSPIAAKTIRRSALDNTPMTFVSVSGSGAPSILMRTFAPNSIVIAGGDGEGEQSCATGATTVTGTKLGASRADSDEGARL